LRIRLLLFALMISITTVAAEVEDWNGLYLTAGLGRLLVLNSLNVGYQFENFALEGNVNAYGIILGKTMEILAKVDLAVKGRIALNRELSFYAKLGLGPMMYSNIEDFSAKDDSKYSGFYRRAVVVGIRPEL
jgi:hypothetical protein